MVVFPRVDLFGTSATMEGLAHYDDPTAGWPDPEHTTLQQAVAALAAAAAHDSHELHHHHPFDLDSNAGPDISRAPGNVNRHDNDDAHNITLAGAAAAAGGMSLGLGGIDLSSHQHLPPFPTAPHHHHQHVLDPHPFALSAAASQHLLPSANELLTNEQSESFAAAQAKKEKKERKRREKEIKRQAEEEARLAISQHVAADNSMPLSGQHTSTSAQPLSQAPSTANSRIASTYNTDPSDAIIRRRGNGDDEGPITNVNEWLAGSWLKGPALRKVAKEKGKSRHSKS
jgi:hypothetical protein